MKEMIPFQEIGLGVGFAHDVSLGIPVAGSPQSLENPF